MRHPTSTFQALLSKRDFYAGSLMILIGLGVALKGSTYRAGTLMHMGPGFMPTALGVLLALLGIAIAAASLTAGEDEDQSLLPEKPQWLAWFCILMSPIAFIVFGRYFGLAPATFFCVFIAALGDKTASWLSSFMVALAVTVFGVGLFSYFLQIPMPVLTWRGAL